MMRRLQPREWVMVIVAGALCIGLLFYMYILRPQLSHMSSIDMHVNRLSSQVKLQEIKAKARQSSASSTPDSKSPASTAAANLPRSSDEPGALTTLHQIGERTHATIVSVAVTQKNGKISKLLGGRNLQSLQLQLDVQGTTPQIQAFLVALHTSNRLMQVDNLSLTAVKPRVTDAKFQLYAFFTNH